MQMKQNANMIKCKRVKTNKMQKFETANVTKCKCDKIQIRQNAKFENVNVPKCKWNKNANVMFPTTSSYNRKSGSGQN